MMECLPRSKCGSLFAASTLAPISATSAPKQAPELNEVDVATADCLRWPDPCCSRCHRSRLPRHSAVSLRSMGAGFGVHGEHQARDGEPGPQLQSPRHEPWRAASSPTEARRPWCAPAQATSVKPWPVRPRTGARSHRRGIPTCDGDEARSHPRSWSQAGAGRR